MCGGGGSGCVGVEGADVWGGGSGCVRVEGVDV